MPINDSSALPSRKDPTTSINCCDPTNRSQAGDVCNRQTAAAEGRLATIRQAKGRLEEREAHRRVLRDQEAERTSGSDRDLEDGDICVQDGSVPEDHVEGNVTDPDSRIMKTGAGCWQQGDNAQAAVDGEEQWVVAAEVSADANDHGKLNAMVDEVAVVAGKPPEAVLAQLEERKVERYVALGREGRSVRRPDSTRRPASARIAQRLTSREGRAIYAQRKWMAEVPIGWIKHVMGFRRFSVRGLEQVQGEWTLVCLALNLRRLNGRLAPC